MTACAIRYRLDGPGPATYLVDCDGQLRVYARGVLGGVMPASRLLAVLADRGCRWVPAYGPVDLDELGQAGIDRERASSLPADPPHRNPVDLGGLEASAH